MRLLAIDIGSARVKGVLFESRLSRYSILRYEIAEVADSLDAHDILQAPLTTGQLAAVREIWSLFQNDADRVVSNIPFNFYTCRLLSFPFSDRRKILGAAQFQIEDEVPFDLEKCIISNQIFRTPEGSLETSTLTGVALIQDLQAMVGLLKEQTNLDPDVLTSTQSATYALLDGQRDLFADRGIAIINLGHRSSSINIYKNCIPVLNRTSMVGGLSITQAIAKQYGIGIKEAEQAKISSGFLAPPGIEQSEDQRAFSDLIAIVLEPVFHDFYQALMAHFSRYRERVSQIYVTGGTALLPGTCDYLAARWQIPVHPLKSAAFLPNASIRPSTNTDLVISQAIHLGLSQMEGRGKETHNFRTGQLRKEGAGFSFNIKNFEKPLRAIGITYAFVVVAMILQGFLLSGQIARKDIRRETAIKNFFGNPRPSAVFQLKNNPERLAKEMESKLNEVRSQIAGAGGEPSFSALKYLREMSKIVPRTTPVEIKAISMRPDRFSLKLESQSENELNAALKALRELPGLKELSEPKIEKGTGTKQIAAFELRWSS